MYIISACTIFIHKKTWMLYVHNLMSNCNFATKTLHIVCCNGWNRKVYLTLESWATAFCVRKNHIFLQWGSYRVRETIFCCSWELLLCEKKTIFCCSGGEHENATIYPTYGQVPSLKLDKTKGKNGEREYILSLHSLCLHLTLVVMKRFLFHICFCTQLHYMEGNHGSQILMP